MTPPLPDPWQMSPFVSGTDIEVIDHHIERRCIRFALFDFDGIISLIREGWQGVMIPMMVEVLLEAPDMLQALCARGIPCYLASGIDRPCVPGVLVSDPIDIVGAGDSTMAGIVTALCAGAMPREAAFVRNLVASITIQQIGTTGTASRQQVLERFREFTQSGRTWHRPGGAPPSSRPCSEAQGDRATTGA